MSKNRMQSTLVLAPVVTFMKTLLMVFNFVFWVSKTTKQTNMINDKKSIIHWKSLLTSTDINLPKMFSFLVMILQTFFFSN